MANVNLNVNAPAKQAPAMAPSTRTDDQILPRSGWVPVGKSNCYLDVENSQSNPIYKIAVDILKHTNFFRAFTASLTIPLIYIQQFWDTIRYDRDTTRYICQLDEQWFNFTKDTLKDALQITPVNNNIPFSSPPTPDALINFVNNLGYPKVVRILSAVMTNNMFQPWMTLTTIINLCLMGKTSGFERPRALVLQIIWGIVNRAHIDYEKRMWEEFTQSNHSFIDDKKNMALHTQGKKKANPIVIPSIRFTKQIIHHLQSKHKFHPRPDSPLHLPCEECILGYLKFSAKGTKQEVFGMPIPNELITADIQGEQCYKKYLEKVAKHQRYLFDEEGSDPDSHAPKPAKPTKKSKPSAPKAAPVTKPDAAKASESTSSQQPKPKPIPAKTQEKKPIQVAETSDEPSPAKSSKPGKVTKRRKPTSYSSLVDEFVDEGIPEREPRFDDEEADMKMAVEESLKSVHDAHQGPLLLVVIREPDSRKFEPLLEVQRKGKDKVSDEQVSLNLLTLQTPKKAGPNPGVRIKGQARSNPVDDAAPQPQLSLVVHDGPNLEHMDLEAIDVSTQQNPEKIDKGFTTTTYPNVQENLKLTVEEQIMENLIQDNKHLEERLDSHGDFLEADKKEILYQRMWKTNSYKAHEDHMMLYEELEKLMNRGHIDELLTDLAKARRKKKKIHDSPKTPPESPPHQPHPPLPLTERLVKSIVALSSSKTDASAEFTAWTTTDTRLRLSVLSIPKDLHMDDDTAADEQVYSSDDEDIRNAHILKVNLQQDWWKPFEENRPATPETAYSIPSSNLLVLTNNWASALTSTYTPLPEHSLLAQTGDMAIFIDWYNVSKPLPLGVPPGQVIIQSDFFFNKDLEYLRYGNKGGRPANTSEGDRRAVRTHMRILSVVRIKVFSMYGYIYMKKIVLRRADLNEHIIAKRDFKYLYPSDFEDLQCIEDFQLGIESYQTQLNLTKPRWDSTGFEYKHDFTVIDSPRTATFREKYDVQMIMRFNEIHKFSDGTLHQIDEALDYRVKEFNSTG
uniref:Monodehydroascorbate reductase n=1 Tax=Tanacetum cinerariifolium TaxID=118510 RepID=A0A699GGY6_TANCI|nr:monodehydroascorbate reductase [Tanacetum cinerariifolium]